MVVGLIRFSLTMKMRLLRVALHAKRLMWFIWCTMGMLLTTMKKCQNFNRRWLQGEFYTNFWNGPWRVTSKFICVLLVHVILEAACIPSFSAVQAREERRRTLPVSWAWTLQVEEVFYLLKYQLGEGFRGMRQDNKKGPSGKEMGRGIKRQNLAFEGEAAVTNKKGGIDFWRRSFFWLPKGRERQETEVWRFFLGLSPLAR